MGAGINPTVLIALGIITSVASLGFGGYLVASKKKNIGWVFLGTGAVIIISVLLWWNHWDGFRW